MPFDLWSGLGWVVGAVVAVWVVSVLRHLAREPRRSKDLAVWRREALAQFDQLGPLAAQLGLVHLETVEVVKEEETLSQDRMGQVHGYTLTRFLRNPQGECFMFKSTPRGPYLKFVTPKVARRVLEGQ